MECHHIRNQLSLFIDGLVSPADSTLIREHLRTCQKCAEEYADLQKTVAHVQSLEEVEPPSWLTQKVITKIRTAAEQDRSFLHKLFYPLHIKLPLEAFAMIAVAVIAFYVFRSTPSELISVQEPAGVTRPDELTEEETRSVREETDDYRPVTKAPVPPEEKSTVPFADDERKADVRMPQDRTTPFPAHVNKQYYDISGKDREDLGIGHQAAPAPPLEPEAIDGSAPAPLLEPEVIDRTVDANEEAHNFQQERVEAPRKEEMLTSRDVRTPEDRTDLRKFGHAAPVAPESRLRMTEKASHILRVGVRDLKPALARLEHAVADVQGEVIETDLHKKNAIVTIRIDPSKFYSFFGMLRVLGTVRDEKSFMRQQNGSGDIMIELVETPHQ